MYFATLDSASSNSLKLIKCNYVSLSRLRSMRFRSVGRSVGFTHSSVSLLLSSGCFCFLVLVVKVVVVPLCRWPFKSSAFVELGSLLDIQCLGWFCSLYKQEISLFSEFINFILGLSFLEIHSLWQHHLGRRGIATTLAFTSDGNRPMEFSSRAQKYSVSLGQSRTFLKQCTS